MHSDKILVMDDGVVVAFDEPLTLLADENGIFSKLVSQTGFAESTKLCAMAQRAADKKKASQAAPSLQNA